MSQTKNIIPVGPTLAEAVEELHGYKEWAEDNKRLVREIDVIINGEDGAARQASLCDLGGQIKELVAAREQLASARTLILNIKTGNIYQEPADECDKWLNGNPETK